MITGCAAVTFYATRNARGHTNRIVSRCSSCIPYCSVSSVLLSPFLSFFFFHFFGSSHTHILFALFVVPCASVPSTESQSKCGKNGAHFTNEREIHRVSERERGARCLRARPLFSLCIKYPGRQESSSSMPSMKWSTFIRIIIINTAFTCQWSEHGRNTKENNKFVVDKI